MSASKTHALIQQVTRTYVRGFLLTVFAVRYGENGDSASFYPTSISHIFCLVKCFFKKTATICEQNVKMIISYLQMRKLVLY